MNLTAKRPIVYLITSGSLTDQNFPESSVNVITLVAAAAESGIQLIQIREKALSTGRVIDLAVRAKAAAKETDAQILINDRPDIAMAAGCDGVHLTSVSVSANIQRQFVPAGFVIGVSAHSVDEVRSAAEDGADFAVFGPVFETPGKPYARGLAEFSRVVESLRPFPVLALGGIGESNAQTVIDAGAAGFAAIRSLSDVDRLRRIAAGFCL